MVNKKDVIKIIEEEIKEIKSMEPESWENETTFETRKNHYLAEAKVIRTKICNELNER